MSDSALRYVQTLERLQAGEPLSLIPTEDLSIATLGVRLDMQDRLGRLNRFANARAAMERAADLAPAERERRVRDAAAREQRGEALSLDDEAALALNAALMLETMQADLERRSALAH